MKYVTIKNNTVQEVFKSEDLVLIEYLKTIYDDVLHVLEDIIVFPGYVYDKPTNKFIEPLPEVVEQPTPKTTNILTVYEFRARFTQEEKVAIYEAALNNILIKIFLDDLSAASNVDLANQELISSLDYMVSKNLIKSNRKAELLKPKVI